MTITPETQISQVGNSENVGQIDVEEFSGIALNREPDVLRLKGVQSCS